MKISLAYIARAPSHHGKDIQDFFKESPAGITPLTDFRKDCPVPHKENEQLEKIQEIPLSELHPFKDHPFKVKDDDAMIETADSIKKYGVLVPAIARPLPDGGYELVAGHRRRRASELAGKETMPVIVRDLDDDAATIIMVDSNLQRENLLPSERAFAYKMKLEAIKHQGARTDLTSVQVEQKLSARDQVAKEAGERSGIAVILIHHPWSDVG